jgi:hypothetical protein
MSLVLEMNVLGHCVPDTVFADIFSGFLSLGDVCRFDSAICSKNRRPLFLKCIESCIFLGDKDKTFGSSAILWLQRRSIRIRHLKCGLIDDDIAMTISRFGSCLHWLSLGVWNFNNRVTNYSITDVGILRLAKGCVELRCLDVSLCHYVTDIGIVKLAELCPNLYSLSVSYCSKITDIGILAEKCPNLHSLDISHCQLIKDNSIIRLAEKCFNLHNLSITGCHNMSDASILRLADGCPQLCSLKMKSCPRVTERSIVRLAEKCHHIHTIKISHVNISTSLFPNRRLIIYRP